MAKKPVVFPDKKKYIYLYCRTLEERNRYGQLAKEAGVSLNKFLLNAIENGLNPPAQSVSSDVLDLAEELNKAHDELRIARILLERYQEELRRANEAAPSLQIDRRLLELFRKARKPLSEEELAYELALPKWDCITDEPQESPPESQPFPWNEIGTIDIEAIAKQLETLEMMALITKFANGWAWNG